MFYGDALGWPMVYVDENSAAVDAGNTIVNLLREKAARDAIALAKVAPRDMGARMQLSIFTDDVDGACASLRASGIQIVSGPIDRSWGCTATIHDPTGHVWELAQEISAD